MGDNTNVSGDIGFRTTGHAKKRLLKRGLYDMVAAMFGQGQPLPKNHSMTQKWRRYENLARATAPLAEGVTPAGTKLVKTDVTVSLNQYGDVVEISDVVKDTHEDNVFQETFDLCGENVGETLEVVTIAVLKAGTSVFYANNAGSRSAVDSPPLPGDFKRIFRSLKTNKAKTVRRKIKASHLVSTEPVDPCYVVMGHTNLKADLAAMEGWVPVRNYANSDRIMSPAEVGSMDEYRFLLTPLFLPWETSGASGTDYLSGGSNVTVAASCDVYPLIIVAQDAYGIVPLQGMDAVTPYVHNPKPTPSDPLGQRGFVSWKTYYASVILNQNWIARYECAATGLPS
jgi:N4-gp56 family major capsid protein